MVRFKDAAYTVVEEDAMFSVVIEKVGSNDQAVTVSVQFISESAISKQLLYHAVLH